MKYDKVVAMNRQQGKQNAEIVKNEIQKMLEEVSAGLYAGVLVVEERTGNSSSPGKIYWVFK